MWTCLITCCTFCLYGQISDTVELSPVKLKAQRLYTQVFQAQTYSFDSSQLSIYTDRSLTQLLQQESHTIIRSYGSSSLSTASFRGKAASHTGVYWNGIRINSPLVGQVDMNAIPINVIRRLKILPGNSSMLIGSGSIGGAIAMNSFLTNLCSDCSHGNNLRIEAGYKIGSYGRHNTNFSIQKAFKNFNIGVGGYYRKAENNFTYLNIAVRAPSIDTQKNAQYYQWGLHSNLQYIPHRKSSSRLRDTFNYAIWYQVYERQIPPLMPDLGIDRDESQKDISLRSSVQYKLHYKRQIHKFNLGISSENTIYKLYFLVPNEKPYEQFNASSLFNSIQLNYLFRTSLGDRHHLNIYSRNTYQWADYSETRTLTQFKAQRYIGQVQAAYLYNISENLHSELLANLSYYQPGEMQVNGSAAIFYSDKKKIKENTFSNFSIGLQIGRNTHQPTLNDLYWVPGGNSNLSTEKSLAASLPVQYRYTVEQSVFSLRLTPYYSIVRDWILWKPSGYRFWSPHNVRSVTTTGLEANFEWKFNRENYSSELRAAYTFSPALDNSVGNRWQLDYQQLPYIPLHQAQLSYRAFIKELNLSFQYSVRLNGARYVDGTYVGQRDILPQYSLQDIQAGYNFRINKIKTRVLLRIENLWNTDYQSIQWRPMPGRSYSLLIQLNYLR